jgi:protease II
LPYGQAKLYHTHHVPYVLVSNPKGAAKSLLVVGYGAYGISTVFNTTRWYPPYEGGRLHLLSIRGGGDDTMEWAEASKNPSPRAVDK